MKIVVQRTTGAQVAVDKGVVGSIKDGLVVLVGITDSDTEKDVAMIVNKLIHLRIFADEDGKLNYSLLDMKGEVLSISQFTLYADVKKGRRPSFVKAAHPDNAIRLYNQFNDMLRDLNIHVETGEFGAMMDVHLINHGPVTIVMETKNGKMI